MNERLFFYRERPKSHEVSHEQPTIVDRPGRRMFHKKIFAPVDRSVDMQEAARPQKQEVLPIQPKPHKHHLLSPDGKFFSWYFDRFPPSEKEVKIYEKLGIRIVKFLHPNNGTLINRLLRKGKLNSHNRDELEKRIAMTKKGERDHVAATALFAATALTAAVLFPPSALPILGITAIADIPLNVYPIMLQRYNRFLATEKLKKLPTA